MFVIKNFMIFTMKNIIELNEKFFSKNEFNIENTVQLDEDTNSIFNLLDEIENNSKDIKTDLNSNDDKIIKLKF